MKKGLGNILVLALVLINLVLTVIIVFTFIPASKKTSALVDKICTIIDLDVEGQQGNDEGPVEDLENIEILSNQIASLSLDSEGKTHYVKLSMTISLNKGHKDYEKKKDSIDSSITLISSKLLDIIGKYQYNEIQKNKVEEEVLRELQTMFNSEFIYAVSFNQFTIQ